MMNVVNDSPVEESPNCWPINQEAGLDLSQVKDQHSRVGNQEQGESVQGGS